MTGAQFLTLIGVILGVVSAIVVAIITTRGAKRTTEITLAQAAVTDVLPIYGDAIAELQSWVTRLRDQNKVQATQIEDLLSERDATAAKFSIALRHLSVVYSYIRRHLPHRTDIPAVPPELAGDITG